LSRVSRRSAIGLKGSNSFLLFGPSSRIEAELAAHSLCNSSSRRLKVLEVS
jgi:hypothetical protein